MCCILCRTSHLRDRLLMVDISTVRRRASVKRKAASEPSPVAFRKLTVEHLEPSSLWVKQALPEGVWLYTREFHAWMFDAAQKKKEQKPMTVYGCMYR